MSRQPKTVEQTVEDILSRTGLRQQIDAEIEAERASLHASLAKRLADGEAAYVQKRAAHEPLLAEGKQTEEAARAAAQSALDGYLKLLRVRDDIYDTFNGLRQQLEPQLREHADPAIDAFKGHLTELLKSNGTLYRAWPDPRGGKDFNGGQAMVDNRQDVAARAQAIMQARDEAERLKLKDFADLQAELRRIEAALPQVGP